MFGVYVPVEESGSGVCIVHNRIVGALANLERGSRSLNPIRKRSTRRNLSDLTVGLSLHLSLGARFGCL
jgi:hypothetical protein